MSLVAELSNKKFSPDWCPMYLKMIDRKSPGDVCIAINAAWNSNRKLVSVLAACHYAGRPTGSQRPKATPRTAPATTWRGVCPSTSFSRISRTGWSSTSSMMSWFSTSACTAHTAGRQTASASRPGALFSQSARERAQKATPGDRSAAQSSKRCGQQALRRGRACMDGHGVLVALTYLIPCMPPHACSIIHYDGTKCRRGGEQRAVEALADADGGGDALQEHSMRRH